MDRPDLARKTAEWVALPQRFGSLAYQSGEFLKRTYYRQVGPDSYGVTSNFKISSFMGGLFGKRLTPSDSGLATQLITPSLTWEENKIVSITSGLLNNRFLIDADVFQNSIPDACFLLNRQLPPFFFASITDNVVPLRNRGYRAIAYFNSNEDENFTWINQPLFIRNK
jgi:hypothetical protein